MIYSVVKKVITPALGEISQTIRDKQSLFPSIDGTISLKEGTIFVITSAESKFPLTVCMVSDCLNVSAQRAEEKL